MPAFPPRLLRAQPGRPHLKRLRATPAATPASRAIRRATRSRARRTDRPATRGRQPQAWAVRVAMAPGRRTSTTTPRGTSRSSRSSSADEASQTCLTCHNRGEHAGWEGGAHAARNVSCTTCHSVHSYKSFAHQLKKETEAATCATCHKAQVIKTERAVTHMPVREGKMSCSSCHNPHGSISNVKALRTGSSVAESCISCHAEMRGPVLWEHAPVRENCATCHDPHGSSNDRMLTVRMPMLCQRCHVATRHPATIYDNNWRSRKQEQPDVRPIVRQLSFERARLEPSLGPVLHALRAREPHAPRNPVRTRCTGRPDDHGRARSDTCPHARADTCRPAGAGTCRRARAGGRRRRHRQSVCPALERSDLRRPLDQRVRRRSAFSALSGPEERRRRRRLPLREARPITGP